MTPGNILLGTVDGQERAYLGDFGLARHATTPTSLTGERSFVGTIDYIAPEQIRGDQLDGRADQYSLACVLYECLSGEQPFARDTDVATVFAHLNERPPSITSAAPDLSPALDGVLARGLAKVPPPATPAVRRCSPRPGPRSTARAGRGRGRRGSPRSPEPAPSWSPPPSRASRSRPTAADSATTAAPAERRRPEAAGPAARRRRDRDRRRGGLARDRARPRCRASPIW